jgi:hypothetical protein
VPIAETAAELFERRQKHFGRNLSQLTPARMAIAGEAFELLGDRAPWRSWKSSGLAWRTKTPKPSAFRSGICSMNSFRLRRCAIRNISKKRKDSTQRNGRMIRLAVTQF